MGSERVHPERWAALQHRALEETPSYSQLPTQAPEFPTRTKERIFARFYQSAAGRAIPARGVGLGLTICHEVVMAHGGAIWVSDNTAARQPCSTFCSPVRVSMSDEAQIAATATGAQGVTAQCR